MISNESGVAGADRVKSREDFAQFLKSYKKLISQFPGFVSLQPSGSYNSNPNKTDFGDIDLIVHIKSDKDKAVVKKELQAFFHAHPETKIVPFSSEKHSGKRSYNAGELVSVRYHDDELGYSAQIDNIVAMDQKELSFKQQFLDMPAEKQGLVLGLVKIAAIETDPITLFKQLGINVRAETAADQEYEFNLSSVKLELRKVTYEPGTFKQQDREVLWVSQNWQDLQKLLYQYDLSQSFEELLSASKTIIKNPRSNQRMQGVFASMITVKSGEVGTAKGAGKEAALAKMQQTFRENRSIFRSLMENSNKKIVFAFGRFQPPTIGHELLITSVKHMAEQLGADHAIYVSKTQDHKSNPLSVDQKIAYLRKMFPGVNFVACDATVRTPIEAAKALNGKYQELIMVAGSDRVASFEKLLNDYNGKEYQYAMLQVVSAGERDPDADDTTGMSGTKMRAAAMADDVQTFMQGLPATISEKDAMNLIELIKQGLQKPAKAKKDVAEGSGGNWYIRVNGKILNDTKYKPEIFSSEDEARIHAMKLADKKRIPLSQIKLTKSWMDAPEQGVAEAEKNPHTSELGRALYRDLSKEKKASPQQVQRNKERWAQRQADKEQGVAEEWSQKYKSSINCSHPKGFSQKAHCAGKKKHNEDMSMEAVCPDCGMCKTHGDVMEIKKGAKDSNGITKCWPGYHADGTKKSATTGKQVRNCVPNEDVEEGLKSKIAGAALAAANLLGSPAQAAEEPVKPITIAYVQIEGEVRKYNLGDKFSNAKEAEKFISDVLDKQGLSGYTLDIKHGYPKKKEGVDEGEKKGLYYYVNKRKKAGTSRDASHPKAPTAQAWKDAAKTAKKESMSVDEYMTNLESKLAEKLLANTPVDAWIKDFEKSNAPQFKGKSKEKRREMAIAASYGAKNPGKKK
jgi:phosphopantetheine adenylyltransferase